MNTDQAGALAAVLIVVMLSASAGCLVTYALRRLSGLEGARRRRRSRRSPAEAIESLASVVPQSESSAEAAQNALARSGIKMAPEALWALRLASAAALCAAGLALGMATGRLAAVAAGPVLGLVIGAGLPQLVMAARRRSWRENIDRELPNALDLMCVSMKAGSTFGAALRTVAARTDGDLADGLADVVVASEFQAPTAALKRFADNAGVQSLTLFCASIAQAERSGMALADVLESQARSVRTQRRLKIEEEINKLPVKMTMPCMLIFTSMLIIVLAPPVAQVAALGGVVG